MTTNGTGDREASGRIVILGRPFALPRTPMRRRLLGWGFIAGGAFSFLPVLGPWMVPVGLWILSVDSHRARRMRRRLTIKVGRRWPRLNERLKPPPPAG